MSLREAAASDSRLLWTWRNDDNTRIWFFKPEPVTYDEHRTWLAEKLRDPAARLLVIQDDRQQDIGQARLDLDNEKGAEIAISIDKSARNKGYGALALSLTCKYAAEKLGVERVTARIKAGNQASIRAFTQAGFVSTGTMKFKGQRAVKMIWSRQ